MSSSLAFCVMFAIASGFLVSAGVTYTGYHASKAEKMGTMLPRRALIVNIVCSLAGVAAYVMASGYGSVSVAMPVETAALLLSNLAAPTLLGFGHWNKMRLVGTLVVCFAATCLGETGPKEAGVTVDHLWDNSFTMPLLLGVFSIAAISLFPIFLSTQRKDSGWMSHRTSVMIGYAVFVAVATALGSTVGKILIIADPNTFPQWAGVYALLGFFSLVVGAHANATCDNGAYLPTNECVKLVLNAILGKFIWQDDPQAPVSYILVYLLMCLGVYLCTSVDTQKGDDLYLLLDP